MKMRVISCKQLITLFGGKINTYYPYCAGERGRGDKVY